MESGFGFKQLPAVLDALRPRLFQQRRPTENIDVPIQTRAGAGAETRTRTRLPSGDFKYSREGRRINLYLIRCRFPFTRVTRSALPSERYGHPGGHLSPIACDSPRARSIVATRRPPEAARDPFATIAATTTDESRRRLPEERLGVRQSATAWGKSTARCWKRTIFGLRITPSRISIARRIVSSLVPGVRSAEHGLEERDHDPRELPRGAAARGSSACGRPRSRSPCPTSKVGSLERGRAREREAHRQIAADVDDQRARLQPAAPRPRAGTSAAGRCPAGCR